MRWCGPWRGAPGEADRAPFRSLSEEHSDDMKRLRCRSMSVESGDETKRLTYRSLSEERSDESKRARAIRPYGA
jgi:hypothetical protein